MCVCIYSLLTIYIIYSRQSPCHSTIWIEMEQTKNSFQYVFNIGKMKQIMSSASTQSTLSFMIHWYLPGGSGLLYNPHHLLRMQ